jgi:TolA-binding protein
MCKGRDRIILLAMGLLAIAGMTGCFQNQGNADQIKEMQSQMAELQKSVTNMNLRLEELNNAVFILQETSKANRDSIKSMKDEMQKPTVYITNPAPLAEPNVLPQGGESRNISGGGFTPLPPLHGAAKAPAAATGSSDFDGAAKQYAQGNYGIAAYDLAAYLARSPSASNAPQARYMLAESYYRLGDHGMAAKEFALLISQGSGGYAPKATLRSAQCFLAQGQSVKAKELLKKVVALYPGSDEAKTAQEELSKL